MLIFRYLIMNSFVHTYFHASFAINISLNLHLTLYFIFYLTPNCSTYHLPVTLNPQTNLTTQYTHFPDTVEPFHVRFAFTQEMINTFVSFSRGSVIDFCLSSLIFLYIIFLMVCSRADIISDSVSRFRFTSINNNQRS